MAWSAPPTSAAARVAPARGCASAASPPSTASTSPPRCSTWPGRARSTRSLVEADVSDTGLASGAYDLVVTCLVDEHLADLRPLYAEARRLARPGGVYVLVGFHPHFIMASGMPTHYDSASGEAVAIQTYVHLLSDHVSAGLAAGLDARRDARARDRRRLARAQAQVGLAARPADRLRGRLARARRLTGATQPFG